MVDLCKGGKDPAKVEQTCALEPWFAALLELSTHGSAEALCSEDAAYDWLTHEDIFLL